MSREVQVSKKVSWLLRHGAEKEGLVLGRGGFVGVGDVVSFFYFSSHFCASTTWDVEPYLHVNCHVEPKFSCRCSLSLCPDDCQ